MDALQKLKTDIAGIRTLLKAGKFAEAEGLARQLLEVHPHEPNCRFALALALRSQGKKTQARETFQSITQTTPAFTLAFVELATTCEQLGLPREAVVAMESALALEPGNMDGWRRLAEWYLAIGETTLSNKAMDNHIVYSGKHPRLLAALKAFRAGELPLAESLCREHILDFPRDVNAIRLLAEIAIKLEIYDDAEYLLQRVLALAPDFHLARLNLAHALYMRERCQEALEQLHELEKAEPEMLGAQVEKAAVLVRLGRFDEAISLYRYLLARSPEHVKLHNSLGHVLKTVGDRQAAESFYLKAIALSPTDGEAYWSLANLKNYRFSAGQIAEMDQVLGGNLTNEHAAQIHFALGKALEDEGQSSKAFDHYLSGNRLKHGIEHYSADENSQLVTELTEICSPDLYATPMGVASNEPIFIVGLPRSGSTLLEQILASHSQVEGTRELPYLMAMVRQLGGRKRRSEPSRYPGILAELSEEQCRDLGGDYLARVAAERTGKPFFIDKMPNNFLLVGLIKKILPHAKIIDARRHPIATCFSNFKQHFANGQAFSYSLEDLGRYYSDYVRLMDHWHHLFPGELLTVHYEQVVSSLEEQVRTILDYCNLPFEDDCLSFYSNNRAVRTASSEQVRQPIYTNSLDSWKPFAPFLEPLSNALGDVLVDYPC